MTARVNPNEIKGTIGSATNGLTYEYRKQNRDYPQELLIKTSGDADCTFHIEISDPEVGVWTQLTDVDGTQLSYTNDIALCFRPAGSCDIRITVFAYTSGTLAYTIRAS